MTFLKQVKYVNIVFLVVGVLLLTVFLTNADSDLSFTEDKTDFSLDETRLNGPRIGLIAWEFLWLSGVTIGFIKLASVALNKADINKEKAAEEFEPKFFKFMIGLLIVTAFVTLILPFLGGDNSPIVQYRDRDNAIEIKVTAVQFSYYFNGNASQTTITLQQDTKYVFVIDSLDTTHGFGLYDPDTRLIAQIQVVPGYENEIVWIFNSPGVYIVRCMEYCGLGHSYMETTITVV